MADALATLARLRRLAADEARRDLAQRLAAETAAEQALAAQAAALTREQAALASAQPGILAASYPAWREAALARRAAAAQGVSLAASACDQARAKLAAVQSAQRAVDSMMEARHAARRAAYLAHAQRALDDTAALRPRLVRKDGPP